MRARRAGLAPLATSAVRRAFTAALAAALFAVPAPALAQRAATDAVGGVTLASRKAPASAAPDIAARSGILVATDGRVVWSRAPHARVPMASTTKMMTAVLAIQSGRLDQVVTVSAAASRVPWGVGLRAGERITKRKLLELALVPSGNDAAYALGEATAGNMGAFVRMMNAKAASLGLRDTRYVNPHGLDAPGHHSSASDLATLARAAMKLPEFRRVVSMRAVAVPAAPGRPAKSLRSTDLLLGRYSGMEGVKTGTTDGAGYCFVGMAKRGNTELTAVVLGASSDAARFAQAARLLDWGFGHLSRRVLAVGGEAVGEVALSPDASTTIPVRLEGPASGVVVAGVPVERRVSLPSRAALPVFEGQPIGEIAIVQGDAVLARVRAVAATSVASVDETVGSVPVSDYVARSVPAVTMGSAASFAFDAAKPVVRRIVLEPSLTAPVRAGQRVGEVVYTQGGREVVTVPVLAGGSVPAPGLVERFLVALTRGWLAVAGGRPTAPPHVASP